MANTPFGFGMPGSSGAWQGNDFESLARQYWGAWGDAMRAASGQPAVPPGMQGWHDAVDWWSKLAHGGRSEANDVVERFNTQARHWFGQMQQVAAQFAGQPGSAGDVANAWKRALGAAGENPFPEIFRAMRGQGVHGLDQWIEDASPYLDAWRREGQSWLSMPAFGLNREHQERMQRLAQAQVDLQEKNSAYNALMLKAGQRAFELFEAKLVERAEPGRQLGTARALFDLWIDAAEESYAEIALSPEFRTAYGALVDAQMRLRGGIQREVELACGMFGMPTRTEVDSAHRKIAELERQLRRARDAAAPAKATPRRSAAGSDPTPGARVGKAPAGHARGDAKPSAKKQPPVRKRAVREATTPASRRAAPATFAGIAIPQAPVSTPPTRTRKQTKAPR